VNVTVIGSGCVGLVVGTCLAEVGHRVVCADIDETKTTELQRGRVPFYEPGLEPLVRANAECGRLRFTSSVAEAIEQADTVFIAVRAPAAGLDPILSVARVIGDHMNRPKMVIVKSTVPVGSTARVRERIAERTALHFDVCYNPEFLREGSAVRDFTRPDRVVLGIDSPPVRPMLEDLYAPFVKAGAPLLFMDIASAELTKCAANAMLATRVSFINYIAELCEATGADVDLVRRGVGSDQRIGADGLFPGPGFGGGCLPKDVAALIQTSGERGVGADLLEAVRRVNARQPRHVCEKLRLELDGVLRDRTIAVWGLAFKAETDDTRESPAVAVVEGLLHEGAVVRAYDPQAMSAARQVLGKRVHYGADPYATLDGADALAVMTEWEVFRNPDFGRIRSRLRRPIVVDARNLYEPEVMRRMGFRYVGVGRGGRE
jgi:UDPglucose 6-dehydrogenase